MSAEARPLTTGGRRHMVSGDGSGHAAATEPLIPPSGVEGVVGVRPGAEAALLAGSVAVLDRRRWATETSCASPSSPGSNAPIEYETIMTNTAAKAA